MSALFPSHSHLLTTVAYSSPLSRPLLRRLAFQPGRRLAAPLTLVALVALATTPPVAAQALTVSGTTLSVLPGTTLFVQGDLLNTGPGTLTNDGTLELTGDFTSTAPAAVGGTGRLRFSGAQDQHLTAPNATTLGTLEVANTGPAANNRLLVPADLTITNQLLLTSGLVRTAPTATITLPDGAVLTGEALHRYVQGNLRVVRTGTSGLTDFGHGFVLDGTGQALGTVTVTRTAGLTTKDLSYGANVGGTKQGIDRIWTVAPTAQPTAPVPVTLSWLADDDNGLLDFSQVRIWQQPTAGSGWTAFSAPISAANRSLMQKPTTLNRLTASNSTNTLPVELVAFTAKRAGPDAVLRWTTASEKANAFFLVESAADGRAFHRIGYLAGQGTSSQPRTYSWLDPGLARYGVPLVYYRLRQVDEDGTESFSGVQAVAVPTGAGTLQLDAFPVPLPPATPLTVRILAPAPGPATLRVTDVLGRVVAFREVGLTAGANALTLTDASQWPAGVYQLQLLQDQQQQTLRLVRE